MNRSVLGIWEERERGDAFQTEGTVYAKNSVSKVIKTCLELLAGKCKRGGQWCGGKRSRGALKSKREAGTRPGLAVLVRELGFFLQVRGPSSGFQTGHL